MLQIKKKANLYQLFYNLQFLFRKKEYKQQFQIKKQITQTVTLRSPKHFNIGKYKIFNVKYRAVNLQIFKQTPFHINTMLVNKNYLFKVFSKSMPLTPVLKVNSVKLKVNTKFKLKWLEI